MADISHLIHEAAREAVEEALRREARSVTGSSRTVSAGGKARRIRRSTADLHETADNLVAYVENNPGQPIGQIAEALNCTSKELRLPVLKLVEEGRLSTEGQRRGTRYFAGKRKAKTSKKKAGRKAPASKTRRKKAARKKS